MNLKMMNEAFKRKHSNTLNEAINDSDKEQLRKALILRSMNVVSNGGSIKQLEIALQDVIENFYPDHCWWEVTDCQIFNELFMNGVNPREICDLIIDQLKPEFAGNAEIVEDVSEEADNELLEALQECLNRLNEAQISDEDKRDSDLIRGMIDKINKRSNAKFTPEEQAVMDKYGITRTNWAKRLEVGDRELNPLYDGNQRKVYNGYNDWKGHYVRNGDPSKINYADRARKLKDRQFSGDTQVSGRYSANGAINAHTEQGGHTLQDVERAAVEDRDKKPVDDMKRHLWDRKYHQDQIDGAQAEYDKSVGDARKKYDDSVKWATDTYRRHTVDAEQSRKRAQDKIDQMLRRK